MSKSHKIIAGVLTVYVGLTLAHVWLNVGFEKLGLVRAEKARASYRVGFLPVT